MKPTDPTTPDTTDYNTADLATVHRLPGVDDAIEGEYVTDEEWALLTSQRAQQQWRLEQYRRDLAVVAHIASTGVRVGGRVTGHGAGHAGRFLARHSTFILRGAESARQRRKAERGQNHALTARAEALEKGDLAQVAELNRQIQESRHTVVDVLDKWSELTWSITKKVAGGLGIALVVALVVGIANGFGGWFGEWGITDVLRGIGTGLSTITAVIAWLVAFWWLLALAGATVWCFRRWKDGTRLGEQVLPEKLRRDTATGNDYTELNESTLVTALANIGLTSLNTHIKQGWPNRDSDNAWVRFPMIDGQGYSAKLRLPLGASVAKVNEAKPLLAHNLGCRAVELFIEPDASDPTVMDLFRLDPGVLREPVGPYPLLHEGTTDYWTGFPVGMSARGDVVTCPVFERNFVFSGAMGSGKSTLVLDLIVGAVLDPLVDIDVFVFAENADYDPLEPVLSTFVKGDTADNVQACMDHIDALHADLTTRGQLLAKHGERAVTRELAAKEPGLRPRIVVIDECQSYFRQDKPEARKAVVNKMVRFYSAARKYGVNLVFVTPNPSDASLPRDLMAVTSNKACGAIGDKARNNIVLGEKAHENGISALGLKPKTKDQLNDAGTLVTVGFMDTPGIVRSFYLTPGDLATIADRGVALRGGQVTTLDTPVVVERDWLADLASVCEGRDKVNLAHAAKWLEKLDPTFPPYRGLDGKTLAGWLTSDEIGVPVTFPSRVPTATTESIRNAAAGRTSSGQ